MAHDALRAARICTFKSHISNPEAEYDTLNLFHPSSLRPHPLRVHVHAARKQLNRVVDIDRFAHDKCFGVLDCDQRAVEPLSRFEAAQEAFGAYVGFRLCAAGVEKL
jgi:hypothetical protein